MPFLFLALGQKLGLDVTASTAPLHVFVKYTDNISNTTYNLETTSGANVARDSWLIENMHISPRAIENDIYMQKLTRKETVVIMADTLLQHYAKQQRYAQAIATADLMLSYYPKSISTMLHRNSSYNNLLRINDLWHYRFPFEVPEYQRDTFIHLVTEVNRGHQHMLNLGWRPNTVAQDQQYLEKVKKDALN